CPQHLSDAFRHLGRACPGHPRPFDLCRNLSKRGRPDKRRHDDGEDRASSLDADRSITKRPACRSHPYPVPAPSATGTIGSSLTRSSVSAVRTLRTFGIAVSSSTKDWKERRSGATHLRRKSVSPDRVQHSRTSGIWRMRAAKPSRSTSAWL